MKQKESSKPQVRLRYKNTVTGRTAKLRKSQARQRRVDV